MNFEVAIVHSSSLYPHAKQPVKQPGTSAASLRRPCALCRSAPARPPRRRARSAPRGRAPAAVRLPPRLTGIVPAQLFAPDSHSAAQPQCRTASTTATSTTTPTTTSTGARRRRAAPAPDARIIAARQSAGYFAGRHVILPKDIAKKIQKNKLLAETGAAPSAPAPAAPAAAPPAASAAVAHNWAVPRSAQSGGLWAFTNRAAGCTTLCTDPSRTSY